MQHTLDSDGVGFVSVSGLISCLTSFRPRRPTIPCRLHAAVRSRKADTTHNSETNQRTLEEIDLLFSHTSPWVWKAEEHFAIVKAEHPELVQAGSGTARSMGDVEQVLEKSGGAVAAEKI